MTNFLSTKVIFIIVSVFSSCLLQVATASSDDVNHGVGELFDFAINAVKNDVHFDQICQKNKCTKRNSLGWDEYGLDLKEGEVRLTFDPTGHVVQAEAYVSQEKLGDCVDVLNGMISDDKKAFRLPNKYLKDDEYERYFYDKYEVVLSGKKILGSFLLSVNSSYESSRKRIGSLIEKEKNLQIRLRIGRGEYERIIIPGLTKVKHIKDFFVMSENGSDSGRGNSVIGSLGGKAYLFNVSSRDGVILELMQVAMESSEYQKNKVFLDDTLKRNKNLIKVFGLGGTQYCVNGLCQLGYLYVQPVKGDIVPEWMIIKAPGSFVRSEEFDATKNKFKKLILEDEKKALISLDRNGFIDFDRQRSEDMKN